MTCIAGIIDNDGTIYVGADSASCLESFIEIRKDSKVFIKNKFIIGCSGDCKLIDVFKYNFVPPTHPKDMPTEVYMRTLFVNAIDNCFQDNDCLPTKELPNKFYELTIMVGYKNRLFIINGNLYVSETEKNYASIGAYEVALGALYATEDLFEPITRINIALEAAQYFNNTVREPFTILKLEK